MLVDHAAALRLAQHKALALFTDIERELIRPGVSERQLDGEIYAMAEERYGVVTHWHKRVIRAGANTLQPYHENPPDRMIAPDDILFVDLGPVFEAWEADFGRTFVLGEDAEKHRLMQALEPVWRAAKAHFDAHPAITGGELYQAACDLARKAGWAFGGSIAGHLVGAFPHEKIDGDRITYYITPGNDVPLRGTDADGRARHWILEIHLIDRVREIGGFFEQLLTIDDAS